jgi:hypothetical protein
MAASCDTCGGIVTCNREAVVLSGDEWYAHRAGTCPDCGNTVQWHRAIAGRLGIGYLYLYSPPPRRSHPAALTTTKTPGWPPKSKAGIKESYCWDRRGEVDSQLQGAQPCQRSGCWNDGKRRTQSLKKLQARVIYLCDECFQSLPVHRLNDLFVRFADKGK